jgi:two-component system OmpR family sensor kinase
MLRRCAVTIRDRAERTPIRLKLALTFAGMMVLLFGVLFLALYLRYAAGLDDGIHASLQSRAAALVSVARQSDSRLRAHPLLPEGSGVAQILDAQGRVLAASRGFGRRPLLGTADLARTAGGPIDAVTRGHLSLRAERVARSSSNVLVVGVSLAERDSALRALQTLLFIGGPIALLLACMAGYIVAAKALIPVESMRRRAGEIYGSELDARLPVSPAPDEIQRLGTTLNEMLDRVEEVVQRERAFVAGASHELRTPLTILRLELEDALAGRRSHEALHAAIGSASEEVARLTLLIEDLLVIAQTDQGRLPLHRERFEVHAAMRVIAERYARLDELVGRTVTVMPGEPLFVEADIARLDQVLSNCVNNALRHGEGPVVLRTSQSPGGVRVDVLDDGPGFPEEFLPRAFERFSRADPARGRSGRSGPGGGGLGLAIVRAIVEAHGGQVGAENRPGGGARVWLILPDCAGAAPARNVDVEASSTP